MVGLRQQPGEALVRRGEARIVARRLGEALMEARGTAAMGERQQLLFAQPEQRALEHRGERQVVLGQQQRVAQRHQVHHRDLVGQHEAVGAGDRHAAAA